MSIQAISILQLFHVISVTMTALLAWYHGYIPNGTNKKQYIQWYLPLNAIKSPSNPINPHKIQVMSTPDEWTLVD